jgi:radical SAM PhpK family P-methyltransferase
MKTRLTPTPLDCVVLGHYDLGFAFHENLTLARGTASGEYRTLRMDFVTVDGKKRSYLDVLNYLTDQQLHWTEMPQVAPVYLTSFLAGRGIAAEFGSFHPSQRSDLVALLSHSPRVVAITTTLYLSPVVVTAVVEFVREIAHDACIVVGGPFMDNLCFHSDEDDLRLILLEMGADVYVRHKQGENTLANLILNLKAGDDPEKVKNCYVKRGDSFVFTGAETEFALEPINWDLLGTDNLGATVQTRTALSCPFRCSFCDYPVRAGKWIPQDIQMVEHELHQIQNLSPTNVVFIDDTFNVPVSRFKEILRMMIRNHFTFRWYSYLRCNIVDEELCSLMAESNCAGVFLGIESGDHGVLKIMNKAATPEQYLRGIKLLGDAQITTFASLIVGFPGETEHSIANTIELIQEARPTFFRGEIWYHNHRAPIYERREQYGIKGMGYSWKHNTMNWEHASDMVLELYNKVTNSIWLPMYDMDFWILPYLHGKGISLEDIKPFVASCNQLLSLELGASPGLREDRSLIEGRLRRLSRTMRPHAIPARC